MSLSPPFCLHRVSQDICADFAPVRVNLVVSTPVCGFMAGGTNPEKSHSSASLPLSHVESFFEFCVLLCTSRLQYDTRRWGCCKYTVFFSIAASGRRIDDNHAVNWPSELGGLWLHRPDHLTVVSPVRFSEHSFPCPDFLLKFDSKKASPDQALLFCRGIFSGDLAPFVYLVYFSLQAGSCDVETELINFIPIRYIVSYFTEGIDYLRYCAFLIGRQASSSV